jgi:hypothetical protein
MTEVKCSSCKCIKVQDESNFKVNKKGEFNKTCLTCAARRKGYRENYKCEHGKAKNECKECKGVSICEHNKRRAVCITCQGNQICEHNKRRSRCVECKGSQICEHNKVRSVCKSCEGGSICEHGKIRSNCKECDGGSICEHDKRRIVCKLCQGSQICEHDRVKSICKDCNGGSICEHIKIRSICKKCGGGSICEHQTERSKCKDCCPNGYLKSIVSSRVKSALKSNKNKKTIEYLGCTIDEFKKHIQEQFTDGMTWDNYGEWHIDHIIPIKYQIPSIEEVIERLHYTNTQPMWAKENISKGNRYIGSK